MVGIHDDLLKPAAYVPSYLRENGYTVVGVNPRKVGQTIAGHPVLATLAEIDGPVDIVDIFRRSVDVPGHLADILAMEPRPRTVWMQLGIRNDEVADALTAEGIDVVQDRCTLADHRAFIGPAKAPPDNQR